MTFGGFKNDFPVTTEVYFQDLKTTRDAAWDATDLPVNVGSLPADVNDEVKRSPYADIV